jgi:hypothetical protein
LRAGDFEYIYDTSGRLTSGFGMSGLGTLRQDFSYDCQ